MQSIDNSEMENDASYSRRRPSVPYEPTVEMTESGHLDKVQDMDLDLDKLIRKDSLFDYGAN